MNKQLISLFFALIFFLFTACTDKDDEGTIVVEKNDNRFLPSKVRPVLEEEQRKVFTYFYQGAEPISGMAYEGNDRGNVVTMGGGGFGVMALIVGAERGWITREQAALQTQKIVHFLGKAERFKGMWSHWYTPDGMSHAFGNQVKTGDIIETSFMVAGLLTASEYYTSNNAVEAEIVDSVASFWKTIDWRHYTGGKNIMHWLWYSLDDRLDLEVKGWHEGWETYLFALAAPVPHNISNEVYTEGWLSNGNMAKPSRKYYGYELPLGMDFGGPMFFSHYSFLGFDPRKLEDNYAHYWKQNVGHTMINRHYCIEEAPKEYKYNELNWGLTACYGSGSKYEYKARDPKNDDGVLAPTAALGSFPYAPFYATQVLMNLHEQSNSQGTFGFADSYRPSEGAFERKHLAIDQGPIVVMIENYRSGLIWNLLMKNEHAKRGLKLAGVKSKPDFKEGFHLAIVNTKTGVFDMMAHPDRENYELDYFIKVAGATIFTLTDTSDKVVLEKTVQSVVGENRLSFFDEKVLRGKKYQLKMLTPDGKDYTIYVMLR